jgi:hypothetical protein
MEQNTRLGQLRSDRDPYDIYSTDNLLDLTLVSDNDDCHFIGAGHILTLEGEKYKVNNIVFRLGAIHNDIGMYAGVDLFNQEPEDANCQISVFVPILPIFRL